MNGALWKIIWNVLASLRLTLVCLAVAIVVVFIGTIAQADEGLYEGQARYFKQWFVWGPMFLGHRLPILLPGGYLLGTVLVVNLIAAHGRRFAWSVRKAGLHLAHAGILVLLVGQLATDMLSVETYLRLREGESRGYVEKQRAHELVLSSGNGNERDGDLFFSESKVARGQELLHPEAPFALWVRSYSPNSEIFDREAVLGAAVRIQAALGAVESRFADVSRLEYEAARLDEGRGRLGVWRSAFEAIGEGRPENIVEAARRLPDETAERLRRKLIAGFREEMLAAFIEQGGAAGAVAARISRGEPADAGAFPPAADSGYGPRAVAMSMPVDRGLSAVNIPFAVVEVVREGESSGTWLVSPWLGPQEIAAGGETWQIVFRPKRVELPFRVTLLDTTHEVYLGTDIPRHFQSRVRIDHPGRGEVREVDISMNHPLRYEGLTFYQYQMGADEFEASTGTSVLLVVRNPVRHAPYAGCVLVAAGLSYQFLVHLTGFLRRRRM